MKIFTSYFAKVRMLEKHNIMPIGIALYPPKWFKGQSVKYVAPTYSILKQTANDEEYIKRYKAEILGVLNLDRFVNDLQRLSNGKNVALCCFEKPSEFCHRQLLAQFMNEHGYDVKEFMDPEKPKEYNIFE